MAQGVSQKAKRKKLKNPQQNSSYIYSQWRQQLLDISGYLTLFSVLY